MSGFGYLGATRRHKTGVPVNQKVPFIGGTQDEKQKGAAAKEGKTTVTNLQNTLWGQVPRQRAQRSTN